jgi:hypothetical protein
MKTYSKNSDKIIREPVWDIENCTGGSNISNKGEKVKMDVVCSTPPLRPFEY